METLHEFMMLFRWVPNPDYVPTDAELVQQKQSWGVWIGGIAAQSRLVSTSQLGYTGKQLQADMTVKNGIHLTDGQTLAGNMVVKAKSLDDALEMAKGCPILVMGGTVEVRDVIPM